MTPEAAVLIKILSDLIVTAAVTLAKVKDMSDEEVNNAIVAANLRSEELMRALKTH